MMNDRDESTNFVYVQEPTEVITGHGADQANYFFKPPQFQVC